MSKSLGNFFTVRDLLEQGVPGEVIRFVMLSTHYRKPMDWTEKKRAEAEKTLRKWQSLTDGAERRRRPHLDVLAAISDDLNTPKAISLLHAHANAIEGKEDAGRFLSTLQLLGIGTKWRDGVRLAVENAFDNVGLLDELIEKLKVARSEKNWEEADRLKNGITAAGVKLMISNDGIVREIENGFDASKLETLK